MQIEATPKEMAEFVVAMRDGEFGADPLNDYYSREDSRLEIASDSLAEALEERDEAFALAAIYPLTLKDLSGKSAEELEQLLADRSIAIRRGLHAMTTGELVAELKRRDGVAGIKVDDAHPYSVVVGDEYKTDIGPAMILVINGK